VNEARSQPLYLGRTFPGRFQVQGCRCLSSGLRPLSFMKDITAFFSMHNGLVIQPTLLEIENSFCVYGLTAAYSSNRETPITLAYVHVLQLRHRRSISSPRSRPCPETMVDIDFFPVTHSSKLCDASLACEDIGDSKAILSNALGYLS
jgi:hypothetical protein